jgi:hypothetical protein
MSCHHSPDDLECTSHPRHQEYIELKSKPRPKKIDVPDMTKYTILEVQPYNTSILLKVQYENCKEQACSYKGTKILVWLNTPLINVVKWRRIDPHFLEQDKTKLPEDTAPSPDARFPASAEGYRNAIKFMEYARVSTDD